MGWPGVCEALGAKAAGLEALVIRMDRWVESLEDMFDRPIHHSDSSDGEEPDERRRLKKEARIRDTEDHFMGGAEEVQVIFLSRAEQVLDLLWYRLLP